MAANLFKRLWIPNEDGTDSTIPCNDDNTAFVCTYDADDVTGNGTRENPYKSIGRALMKSGVTYINFRGVPNEFFYQSKTILGDDVNQTLIFSQYQPSLEGIYNATIRGINFYSTANRIMLKMSGDISGNNIVATRNKFIMLETNGYLNSDSRGSFENSTIKNYSFVGATNNSDKNNIVSAVFDVDNSFRVLKYSVISAGVIFKFSGVVITPEFGNNSIANVQILRYAYIQAGMSEDIASSLFYKDFFENETCKIILEQKDGGIHPNIFCKYNVDGTVEDYSLNPNPLNEALHASDIGGCVGCFPAAIAANNWGSIINVNADGSDDVLAGQLLQSDFTFSHASGQTWNRVRGAVEKIEKPGIFKGLNCDTNDGTPWGDYFGKKQNLVSDVALNPTDALEANTRYKVSNTADHSNYVIVIYKGVQYPPDFFFVTDATNLTFDLLNADSGSVVRKVFATPLESGEIIPFDDYTTPSAFPRFSAPFMGDVLMLFHKIGANINQPVLFSEVTNDKMAYYANWAVTNADQEFVTLAADTVNYYYKIPVLTYYKKELNAHFDANYDQ